jgi:hypothetical protein
MKHERKPLIFCVAAGELYDPYCGYALELGIPVFRSADRAARIYRKYLEYVFNPVNSVKTGVQVQ